MKTIKDYTETELKALAYEAIVDIEKLKANLDVIHKELAERVKTPPEPTKKK